MSKRNLTAEIRAFLSDHGPATASGIAMAVRARRAAVDAALAGDAFCQAPRPEWGNPRAVYFDLSERVPASDSPVSACARILALLSDGRPHSHHEIYALGCVGHSRIAELRRRGHPISKAERVGDAYVYRLLDVEDVAA